jgi:hypothetical protein
MSKRSWKMGWGKMDTILDERRGRAVGAQIVLTGRSYPKWCVRQMAEDAKHAFVR